MLARDHIADEVLLDYAEERLDAGAAGRVRAHLETGCERCARELAFWRRSLVALQADRAPAPLAAALERAVALFERLEQARKPPVWERLVAALAFDSRLQPALAGARDTGMAAFHLLFESRAADVDLVCEREEGAWQITGQALGAAPPATGWRIAAAPAPVGDAFETQTDALGMFHLRGLAPGTYNLVLRGLNQEIVLPGIELPAV